jgi:hypothetical protein
MVRFWIGLLLTVLLAGCANVSRYERPGMVAHGQKLDGAVEPLYYIIAIDGRKGPDERTLNAGLKLAPQAPLVKISALTPDTVKVYLPKFVPPPQWPERERLKASQDDAYEGGGFFVKFDQGRFQFLGICSNCAGGWEQPSVATPEGVVYSLPLTHAQLSAVFGEAKRVYKVSEVRY